jgi:hypothetical protein
MEKKKLKLSVLKINSHIIRLKYNDKKTIEGGDSGGASNTCETNYKCPVPVPITPNPFYGTIHPCGG